jgi:uncharacterized protein YeaO (DUF488 family)
MLREIGLSDSTKLKINKSNCIYVARNRGNDELAPSEELLYEFKQKVKKYENKYGKGSHEAHNRVFKSIDYKQKFRKKIFNNPKALKKLEQLSIESRNKNIYLICYEGPFKACHRRILLRICELKFGAKIKIDGVEP